MTAHITITWHPNHVKEARLSFSDDFNRLEPSAKADCLKDAMLDIAWEYDAVLKQMRHPSQSTLTRDSL